jgi:hypothetical protein
MYTGSKVYMRIRGKLLEFAKMGSEHNATTANGSAMRDQFSTIQDPNRNLSVIKPPTGFSLPSFGAPGAVYPVRGPAF